MMWFSKRFRRKSRDRDDPFQVLERMRVYFEEAKKELEGVSQPAPRQVLVIQRNVDLVKPVNLLAGFLILALGVGIGWWSKDQNSPQVAAESYGHPGYLDQLVPNESGEMMLITPGGVEESEPDADKLETLADDSAAAASGGPIQHSSSDTLLRKVQDLLERVEKSE